MLPQPEPMEAPRGTLKQAYVKPRTSCSNNISAHNGTVRRFVDFAAVLERLALACHATVACPSVSSSRVSKTSMRCIIEADDRVC
jgi:hypothetical protein